MTAYHFSFLKYCSIFIIQWLFVR